MTGALGWIVRPEARRVALAAALAVTAAYQLQRPIQIPVGSTLLEGCFREFWSDEGGYRWSRSASAIVFPDPGPGVKGRVWLQVSGWRPRGQEAPWINLEAGRFGLSARASPRGETLQLETVTSGWWRSDLVLRIDSDTFTPGPEDPRALGVRVHGARFEPIGASVALRRPPFRQIARTCVALFLLFGLLVRVGASPRAAGWTGLAAAGLAGAAYAWARPYAALASLPALVVVAVLATLAHLAPAAATWIAVLLAESARALAKGARSLATPATPVLVVAGSLAVAWAYRARPTLEIDLGSGREAAVAAGFGAFDSHEGATFRAGRRGASLDLRDFGSGAWKLWITASVSSPTARRVDLVRMGSSGMLVTLNDHWYTVPLDATLPAGWRSGLVLDFPGGGPLQVRIDKVRIERSRSLPPLRIVAALVGAALLLAAGLGAVGLSRPWCLAAAALVLAAGVASLWADPPIAIPFAVPFFGISAAGALLLALAAGARTLAERRGAVSLPPGSVLAAAGIGFVAWLAATAFPLYRGGNFVFHSSISEEIWKGRFLTYYLPHPGSMLSRQAQWGNIVVPHPCLEQTVLAPLAALPQPWFYLGEKVVLALWLASMALMAAGLAQRVAGPRAGFFAAAMTVCLVPAFQLLGLGHLMTLFGCWASSLALSFLVLRLDRLSERRVWWTAVGLFALSFLSYFASLLFGVLVLALVVALLWRRDPVLARPLLAAALAAGALAFLLYYVNWAWPFLSQSVPRILSGSSRPAAEAATPILKRLALQPHKLAYSYGSVLVPLAGLAGLAWRTRGRDRLLLLAWAAVLVLVSGVDVAFNFLLKHHYFVMVPVAVGTGLVLAWLFERGRAGRLAAGALLILAATLAAGNGMAVALGEIP